MAKSVPSYLETAVVESGDTQAEVLLSLVEATEAQTEVLERIATAIDSKDYRKACEQALACCQDGDPWAAAHILHSVLEKRPREPFIGSLQPDAH